MSLSFPKKVDAVLLAGGEFNDVPQGEEPPKGKGLLQIAGVPMAARVLSALRESDAIGRIILVSSVTQDELSHPCWDGVDVVVPAGSKLIDSFKVGVDAVSDPAQPALVTVGDLPLLTAEAVTDWVDRCRMRSDVEIWYSFLRRSVSEQGFPGVRHTYVPFKEGVFCGAGFFMSRPQSLAALYQAMTHMTWARKNPLRLARLLGFKILAALVTRQLSIAETERGMQRLLGGTPCAGIESPYPETAFNVDDLEALEAARGYFKEAL